MNNHFKRRRFYSEKLSSDLTGKDSKDNPIPDFTLPDSPKISNLELIHEIDDFELDAGNDIFSDFLGIEGNVDKASLFNQLTNASTKGNDDSFELEIASRKEREKAYKKSGKTNLPDSTDKLEESDSSVCAKNGFMFLEEGFDVSGFELFGGKNKNINGNMVINGKIKHNKQQVNRQDIILDSKKKMLAEMLNFKVDIQKKNFGNRNRSQSYSLGHNNSIFDFLNRK